MADAEESSGSGSGEVGLELSQKHSKVDFDLDAATFVKLPDEEKERVVEALIQSVKANVIIPPGCPLFELFSASVEFNRESWGELYGYIEAKDGGDDAVVFFDCDEVDSHSICSNGFVTLSGPTRSLLSSGTLKIDVELYVKVKGEVEEELQVSNQIICWDYTHYNHRLTYEQCRFCHYTGKHGRVTLFYVALKYAVQATVVATLVSPNDGLHDVYGSIVAYYGNFWYDSEPYEKELYRVTLFNRPSDKHDSLKKGGIPLSRSVIAVPSSCSLVIEANFRDFDSKDTILSGTFTFPAYELQEMNDGHIEHKGCRINFKVDWKCESIGK